jgi:serine/threonine protein kinase
VHGELFDYLANEGRFSVPLVKFYFNQLLAALKHVHSMGFAHRDLKPSNLLLDENFNLLLADFGHAARLEGSDGKLHGMFGTCGYMFGTCGYQAPEILLKKPYSGTAVDVFASGVLLYNMHAGSSPFNEATDTDFYYMIIRTRDVAGFNKHTLKAFKDLPGDPIFSEHFRDLIFNILEFDPNVRFKISKI